MKLKQKGATREVADPEWHKSSHSGSAAEYVELTLYGAVS